MVREGRARFEQCDLKSAHGCTARNKTAIAAWRRSRGPPPLPRALATSPSAAARQLPAASHSTAQQVGLRYLLHLYV